MVSLIIGRSPPWCIPIPFYRIGSIDKIYGSYLSSSERQSIAELKINFIFCFSSSEVKSNFVIAIPYLFKIYNPSTSLLLKLKIITGSNFFSIISLSILNRSEPSVGYFFFLLFI